MPEPVSPADTIRAARDRIDVLAQYADTWQTVNDLTALADLAEELLAVGERDKAEIEALVAAVEGLLDVGTRSRSGDPSLDPEEWYAIRDYAQNALKDGIGVVEDIRDARERDRRQIAQLTERDDWLLKQLDGCIESAETVANTVGLALARAVVGDLRDARAVLADKEDARPVPSITREDAMSDIENRLYEQSDEFDPAMPNLVQRSGMTRSRWHSYAESFVEATPWLAAYIASLPEEDSGRAAGEGDT